MQTEIVDEEEEDRGPASMHAGTIQLNAEHRMWEETAKEWSWSSRRCIDGSWSSGHVGNGGKKNIVQTYGAAAS